MKKLLLSSALVAILFGSVFAANKSNVIGSADEASIVEMSSSLTNQLGEAFDDETTTSTSTTSTKTTSTTNRTTTSGEETSIVVD